MTLHLALRTFTELTVEQPVLLEAESLNNLSSTIWRFVPCPPNDSQPSRAARVIGSLGCVRAHVYFSDNLQGPIYPGACGKSIKPRGLEEAVS